MMASRGSYNPSDLFLREKKSKQRKRVSILLPVTFLCARLLYSLSRRK